MASSHRRCPCFTSHTPHFFKVILDRTLAEGKLAIPKKFVKEHGKVLVNEEVLLKVANGTEWNVRLTKSSENVWLENGWQEFVNFFSVGLGYFLIFRHQGKSCFHVIICDHTAVEIEYPASFVGEFHDRTKVVSDGQRGLRMPNMRENNDNFPSKRRREDETQTPYSQVNKKLKSCEDEACKKMTICSSRKMVERKREPHRPEGFNSHLHCCSQFKVYSRRSMARQINSEVKYSKGMGNLATTREEQRRVSRANTSKSKHDQDVLRIVKKEPQTQGLEDHKVVKSENCRGKQPWTATATATANPSFMVTMGPSYVTGKGSLNIPKSFAEVHLKKSKEMKVEVSDGRAWKIWCSVRWINGLRRMVELRAGWRAFARDNNLEEGDLCVFEMVKRNRVSFFKVEIFKARNRLKN